MIPPSSTCHVLRKACVVLLLGMLATPDGHACRRPPDEQNVTPERQIALGGDVSVARVVRATPIGIITGSLRQAVEYEFEVQHRITGLAQERFVLVGAEGETRPASPSGGHDDPEFWRRGGGRLYNDADCVLRPDFVLGEYYLVFRDKPATWRSFEHIATVDGQPDPDDKWLAYVKDRLERRH